MDRLKKTAMANTLVSIVFILVGLMLAFKPDTTMSLIVNVIGLVIIAFGAIKLFNYFRLKKELDILEFDLLYGIVGIILGLAVMVFGQTVVAVFRIIIGIWVIYNAVLKIQLALYLKKASSPSWAYVITVAALMLICGIFITFKSNAIISTIGIVMIAYAVMDLIENIIAMKDINKIYIK